MEASYSAMNWGRSTHICYKCDGTVLSAHTPPFVHLYMSHLHPGGSDSKESACNVGQLGSIPGSRRSLGEGNGNPLQYSCLENPMDRGAWRATVHGVTKSWTQLSDYHTHTFYSVRTRVHLWEPHPLSWLSLPAWRNLIQDLQSSLITISLCSFPPYTLLG